MSVPRLGQVQVRVLQVLRQKGRATACGITNAFNTDKPIFWGTNAPQSQLERDPKLINEEE